MKKWWIVKVLDQESKTSTSIGLFGKIQDIIQNIEKVGDWQFVSARVDPNQ